MNTLKILSKVIEFIVFIAFIILIFVLLLYSRGYFLQQTKENVTTTSISTGTLFIDESAKTGFLNTEKYMARFETIEFPIAGSEKMQTVCRIDIWVYPDIEHPIEYIVDSFEEAVKFLEELRYQSNKMEDRE